MHGRNIRWNNRPALIYIDVSNTKGIYKTMCYADKNLKLCTCGGEIDKSKPHWTLRTDPEFIPSLINGMIRLEMLFIQRSELEEWILGELNNQECFDFDYTPNPGDTLEVNLNGQHLHLRYSGISESWKYSDDDSLIEKERVLHGTVVEQDKLLQLQASTFNANSTPSALTHDGSAGSVGYIYLAYDAEKQGYCKVGCTTRKVDQRLSETTNPHYRFYNAYQLVNVDIQFVEQRIHAYIESLGVERISHENGNVSEWFREDKASLDCMVLDYLEECYPEKLLDGLTHEEGLEFARKKAAFAKEKEQAIDKEIKRIEQRIGDIFPTLERIQEAFFERSIEIEKELTSLNNPEKTYHWFRNITPYIAAIVFVAMFFHDNPTASLVIGGLIFFLSKPKQPEIVIPHEEIQSVTHDFAEKTGFVKLKALVEAIKTFNDRHMRLHNEPIKNPFFSVQLTTDDIYAIETKVRNERFL
jgi:hypothetical protein